MISHRCTCHSTRFVRSVNINDKNKSRIVIVSRNSLTLCNDYALNAHILNQQANV